MYKLINLIWGIFFLGVAELYSQEYVVPGRWSEERINKWYQHQPWLVGCNYIPSTAINQIDMWQKETWNPGQIEKELDWAREIGMNTLRVFLHDLVWEDDEQGLYKRMDEFLSICKDRHIRPWFVFFDDCHSPNPRLGIQPLPVRAYHNSGWVTSPSRDLALRYYDGKASEEECNRLKCYVQKTMQRFSDDDRILMWELYNEPGRGNGYDGIMEGNKFSEFSDKSSRLVYDSWVWAREVNPSQPITSCGMGSVGNRNIKINEVNCDVFSIHSYQSPADFEKTIVQYLKCNRPVFVSEWLCRPHGNTPQNCLPIMKRLKVGNACWGFVSGKTGTIWSWSSRKRNGKPRNLSLERKNGNVLRDGEEFPEPKVWFHDLFRKNGIPYDINEIECFKCFTK